MAYFPNGTSHEAYSAQFCAHCVNWRDHEDGRGFGCPIMDLHMLWNYDAVGANKDETKEAALEMFIPTGKAHNERCAMFLPHDPGRCTETRDMFND